jgi:DNA polymerase-4
VFVSREAAILHADLDSFFASVEQRDDPKLRGKPVIVGGGVVLAASYEAKAYGVAGGMGGGKALRLCPHALVVPARMEAYSQASKDVFAVFEDMSPVVEGISIDEAFLDVRGMEHFAGTPRQIAERLRARVREEVGLPITVGVATTKHLAKIASQTAKPDGLLVVPAGEELAFLHPLPVERIWGVGPKTAARLHARGLLRIGQIAEVPEGTLMAIVGRAAGRHLHALANNRDPRVVKHRVRRRSIGSQRALGRKHRSAEELDTILVGIVDRVAGRLRSASRACRTVVLRLRFADYATRITRSHTMAEATTVTSVILDALRGLLAAAMPLIREHGITLLGLSLTNLCDADAVQLALPLDRRRPAALDTAVDGVRERFGKEAITRAVLLDRDPGVSMPLLPD